MCNACGKLLIFQRFSKRINETKNKMASSNRKFWSEFLELYRNSPMLWKVKSAGYRNRNLKARAYEKLIRKLKEIEPKANREMVVRKINTFRTNYKRDLNKIKRSKNSGAGMGNVFKSSLWYFDSLSFLEDQKDCSESGTTMDSDEDESMVDENRCKPPLVKKRKTCSEEDNLINMACSCSHLKETNDNATVLAKGWALQYSEMSNHQKILTRKIISDTLFHGCLGHLTESVVKDIQATLEAQ